MNAKKVFISKTNNVLSVSMGVLSAPLGILAFSVLRRKEISVRIVTALKDFSKITKRSARGVKVGV